MEKILTEELLKQIRLMSYDRGIVLSEQILPTDRLGKEGTFQPYLPTIEKTEKKEKSLNKKQEELNKFWKPRLCKKRHEEMCQTFGGTKVYPVKGSKTEEMVLGYGYTCGCKVNGEITLGDGKTQRVNEYLMNPFTKFTYNVKDFLQDEHNVLMIGSIIFTFGGSAAVGLGFDILDAILYVSEGNPYMAGLNFLFAIVPLEKIFPGIKSGVKTFTKTIINKLNKGIPLDEIEEKVLKYVTSKKTILIAYKRLFKMKINQWLKTYDVTYFIRILLWLVKKGVLASSFLIKYGLLIGGVFYSWSKLAEIFNIKESSEKQEPKTNIYNEIKEYLYVMIDKNKMYTDQLKNQKLNEIAVAQYVLYSGGYFNLTNPSIKIQFNHLLFENSESIKNIKILTSTGKLIEEYNNNGKNKFITNKTLKNGSYIVEVKKIDGNTEKIKLNFVPKSTKIYELTKPKIKWGYFDGTTKIGIMNYQKNNGLSVNGILNQQTLVSMYDKIKNGKMGNLDKVHQYVNFNFGTKNTIKPETKEFEEMANLSLKEREKEVSDSLINATEERYDKLFSIQDLDSASIWSQDYTKF